MLNWFVFIKLYTYKICLFNIPINLCCYSSKLMIQWLNKLGQHQLTEKTVVKTIETVCWGLQAIAKIYLTVFDILETMFWFSQKYFYKTSKTNLKRSRLRTKCNKIGREVTGVVTKSNKFQRKFWVRNLGKLAKAFFFQKT